MAKFRARVGRVIPQPYLGREVDPDEAFEIDDQHKDYIAGLREQIKAMSAKESTEEPYFEDVTPAKRPAKEKD